MLDVGIQAEKTRTRKKCAHRVDALTFMRGIICPVDETKFGGWEGNSECPQPQRKEMAEKGIKITANNTGTSKKAWRYQTHACLQHPYSVTMDTLVLRQQRDLHTSLGLGKQLRTYASLG